MENGRFIIMSIKEVECLLATVRSRSIFIGCSWSKVDAKARKGLKYNLGIINIMWFVSGFFFHLINENILTLIVGNWSIIIILFENSLGYKNVVSLSTKSCVVQPGHVDAFSSNVGKHHHHFNAYNLTKHQKSSLTCGINTICKQFKTKN